MRFRPRRFDLVDELEQSTNARFALCRAAMAATFLSGTAFAASSDPESRAAAWLRAWDSQGTHRTATAGDEAGATWLAREAAAIAGSGRVTDEPFSLERLDPADAYVEFEGQRIKGEPLFDAPPTSSTGVRGQVVDVRAQGPIAVVPLSPSVVYGPEYRRMRRSSSNLALVIVTTGGVPGLALLNAELFRTPYGPPTLQVSNIEQDRINAAVGRKAEFHVVVTSTRTQVNARNIVVTIAGRDRNRPPVVVMTPRSSWWQSTSERGGGLVCWLETLRAVTTAPPACDVIFTANSGHELGHLGLDAFIARRPGWDTKATWIHYGANIGTKHGKLVIQSNDDKLRTLTVDHLTRVGQKPDSVAEKTVVPIGETRDIHGAGGHYVTLIGPPDSNPVFHMPQDRWPDAVDVVAIARTADAMAKTVVALTR